MERTSENTPIGISITELGAKRSKLQSDVERVAASISGACRNRIVEQLDWEPISECEVFCTKLIDECAVIDAIGALIEVRRDTSPADYDYISRTIDLLLPLNYAREKILRICELLQNGKVRFIEGEVGNKSVADVLMAGYDCAPIKLDAKSEKGVTAIDMDGPPPEAGMKPHQWNVLAFLIELVARYETVFHSSEPSNHNNTIDALAKTLESWIKGYAKMKKRTVYLMVNFPVDTLKREQALSTLTTISEIVPSLFFVEIVQRVDSTEQQIFQCLRLRLKDR